ncbi:hypothetical protein V6N11_069613 [Hibiscus sabdariffa]|uniref:Uncharacterized protein n=1 Tax=Hibiscus sabdariffa TaxID=183260 RepID=A0ABR2Q395_9ROSI
MVELRHKEHIDPLIEYTSRARDCAVLGEGTWEVDSPYHRASQLGHLLHSRWKSQCYSGFLHPSWILQREKREGNVEYAIKDKPRSNEVWMKVLAIEDKIDVVTSVLGKVATTVQMFDLAQNLFYAYIKTWHKYALVVMSRVVIPRKST